MRFTWAIDRLVKLEEEKGRERKLGESKESGESNKMLRDGRSNVLTNFCVYYKFKFEFPLTESIISQISGKSI